MEKNRFQVRFGKVEQGWALCVALLSWITEFPTPVAACDACDFFLKSTHRTGTYALVVVLDRSPPEYPTGRMPLVAVTVVNHGKTRMYVDARTPIWQQTAYHIRRVGYSDASESDVVIDRTHGKPLLPGASYTFPSVSLTKWGMYYRSAGTYRVALSYGVVDSAIVTFSMR